MVTELDHLLLAERLVFSTNRKVLKSIDSSLLFLQAIQSPYILLNSKMWVNDFRGLQLHLQRVQESSLKANPNPCSTEWMLY